MESVSMSTLKLILIKRWSVYYHGAPSEVLWGLAINNTCGVPFLTFTWLLAMHFRRRMAIACCLDDWPR